MARYDRIARIDPPARDDCFSGWLTMRDLDGREREPELGRRAHLHFMALRPVRRLLLQGLEGPAAGSLESQLDAVREQVERLPDEDAGRQRLTRYLQEIGGRSPAGLARATLGVGAAAEAAGHQYAAEEFYRTALELTEAHSLGSQRAVALRHLGRVQRARGEFEEATASLEESASTAQALGESVEWARSMEALAAVHVRSGEVELARSVLRRVADSPQAASTPVLRAIAAAGRCALELARDNPEAALEAGWTAATTLSADDEARNQVLLNMAAAFRRMGLGSAAESCYGIVVRWAAWPEHRVEAGLENALVAAEAGDRDTFAMRRKVVLEGLGQVDRPLQAMIQLGLGRGGLLVGDVDDARDHLREAIATARDVGADEVLSRSEELLGVLEERGRWSPTTPGSPSEDARRIADRIEELDSQPAL